MNPREKSNGADTDRFRRDSVEDEAAQWLARREAGITDAEAAEYAAWLAADARHGAAIAQLEAAWRYLQKPLRTGQSDGVERRLARLERGRRVHARRRFGWGIALTGLGAAAALWFSFAPLDRGTSAADPPTAAITVRPERQVLADGSVIELNVGAHVELDFTPDRRAVHLVRGEAHFAVAKDPARPFVVSAGHVAVRAVGTEFTVRVAPAAIDVIVSEGKVAVMRDAPRADPAAPGVAVTPEPVLVPAGGRVTAVVAAPAQAELQPETISPAELARGLAWRTLRVEFNATTLGEAVALFNRHNRLQLATADAATAQIRISGIFWANDPEAFARLLEPSAGLKAAREGEERIVISAAP